MIFCAKTNNKKAFLFVNLFLGKQEKKGYSCLEKQIIAKVVLFNLIYSCNTTVSLVLITEFRKY